MARNRGGLVGVSASRAAVQGTINPHAEVELLGAPTDEHAGDLTADLGRDLAGNRPAEDRQTGGVPKAFPAQGAGM